MAWNIVKLRTGMGKTQFFHDSWESDVEDPSLALYLGAAMIQPTSICKESSIYTKNISFLIIAM